MTIGAIPDFEVESFIMTGLKSCLVPSPVENDIIIKNGKLKDNAGKPAVTLESTRSYQSEACSKTNFAWTFFAPIKIYSDDVGKAEARAIKRAITGYFLSNINAPLDNEYEVWLISEAGSILELVDSGGAGYAGYSYLGIFELKLEVVQNERRDF